MMSYEFDTLAAAVGTSIGTAYDSVVLAGYSSAGDGGQAVYKRVGAIPSHPGYFQSNGNTVTWEITGPRLPVEAFGAKGNCPDVSMYAPTDQTSIVNAIAGATNDAVAFQNAFQTAYVLGGCIVEFGGGGASPTASPVSNPNGSSKRYRIALSPTGVNSLVIGAHTELACVGGGWLEFDPSLLIAAGGAPCSKTKPTGRAWPDPGLGAGDPVTGTVPSPTFSATAGSNSFVATSGFDTTTYVDGIRLTNVDIRCYTRVFWHALSDIAGSRRYRLYGVWLKFARDVKIDNCHFYGLPNAGCRVLGSHVRIIDSEATLCGYGGVAGTDENGFSVFGPLVVGHPELSAESSHVIGCTGNYNKDEGIMFGPMKQLELSGFTATGNHDSAIEGDSSFSTTDTSATFGGQEIPLENIIDACQIDGRHAIGTGTITAGDLTHITMQDAFYLTVGGTTPRYLYIPGAAAGSGAGPFQISSVDYTSNIVTLASAATNAVSGAACYVYGREAINISCGNQGRTKLANNKVRRIYGGVSPVSVEYNNGGRVEVIGNTLEDVSVPVNTSAIHIQAEYASASDNQLYEMKTDTGSNNPAGIRMDGTRIAIITDNVVSGGQLSSPFRINTLSGGVDGFIMISNNQSDDCYSNAVLINLNGALSLPIMIHNNTLWNTGFGYNTGAIRIYGGGTAPAIYFRDNVATPNTALASTYPINLTGLTASPAIGYVSCRGNEWGGAWTAGTGKSLQTGTFVTTVVDVGNDLPGQRLTSGSALPASSSGRQGDFVKNVAPAESGTTGAKYVTLGWIRHATDWVPCRTLTGN